MRKNLEMAVQPGTWLMWTAIVAFITLLGIGCASSVELTSEPSTSQGAIDGRLSEWGPHWKVFRDEGIYVQVQNDAEHVYFGLMARDEQTVRQIRLSGLSITFDRIGTETRSWGIRFPLGMRGELMNRVALGRQNPEERQNARQAFLNQVQGFGNELEIYGPGENDVVQSSRLTSLKEYGIEAAVRDSNGVFLYELKIPRTTHAGDYTLGDLRGKSLGVTIETGKMTRMRPDARSESGGGQPPMGGRGGRGGGRGGNVGGQADRRMGNEAVGGKSISLSLSVQLK
ncbi:MAG: hypothetical protein V1799_08485 [bacterium]